MTLVAQCLGAQGVYTVHILLLFHYSVLPYGAIFVSLTCAVYSVSHKASRTCTLGATKSVTADSIHITVVYPNFTLINICKKKTVMCDVRQSAVPKNE